MKKIKSFIAMAALAVLGFSSCNDELAQPPMNIPAEGIGSGAWNAPMSAYQASLGAINKNLPAAWVKGYIVGYVDTGIGNTINDNTSKFTVPTTVKTNILIADTPNETDWRKCVTVQLPSGAVRTALSLGDKPDNLGKLVCIKGTTGDKYCGAYGIRSVSSYNWGDQGKDDGSDQPNPDPQPAGVTVYQGLLETETTINWTINADVTGPVAAPWSWKAYSGKYYLNASAFSSILAAATADAFSPEIDLAGYKTASFTFDHAAKFQTTIKELCYPMIREAGSKTWEKLTVTTWPGTTGWTFVNAGAIDITKYAGKKVQVGFHYGASTAGADTWEIKNVKVTGTK